jgi:hypothetical protein
MIARLLAAHWEPLVIAVLGLAVFIGGWFARQGEVSQLKLKLTAQAETVRTLEQTVYTQARKLAAEREAALSRAVRLEAAEKDHEEFSKTLDSYDLRPDWTVPDALYERLCRPVFAGD